MFTQCNMSTSDMSMFDMSATSNQSDRFPIYRPVPDRMPSGMLRAAHATRGSPTLEAKPEMWGGQPQTQTHAVRYATTRPCKIRLKMP